MSSKKNETISSLDLLMRSVAYTLASEITEDRIEAKVETYRIKKDRHGRDILVIYLKNPIYGRIVVAYGPQFTKMLYDKLKELGISKANEFFGHCFEFEKVKVQKIREDYTDPYPRFLPVKRISCEGIE